MLHNQITDTNIVGYLLKNSYLNRLVSIFSGEDSIDYFPIGGSNATAGFVQELNTDEEIIDFLTAGGYNDSGDPTLVDVGEYYLTIEDDDVYWGCITGEYLKKFGLTTDELNQDDDVYGSGATVEQIAEYFKEIGYDDFDYEDPFYGDDCDMTVSELIDLYHEVDPQNTLGL